MRARYYSSEYGRFITEDPSKYGSNWYCYCNNNPIRYVDSTGLRPHNPPIPEESRGDSPVSSGNVVNTGNTNNLYAGTVSDVTPAPPPAFEDGRGESVDVTPPKPSVSNGNMFATKLLVEENHTAADEILSSAIEDIVITSYESAGTGLIRLTEGVHFSSYIDDLLKISGKAFDVAGVAIDFIGELQDGNNIAGAAILAAGHFAVAKIVETLLMSAATFYFVPSLSVIIATTLISIAIASAITAYIDRKII